MIDLHKLDRKITIEEYSTTTNAIGEDVGSWSVYHTAFAQLKRTRGSEKQEGGKLTATNEVDFKLRFFDGIDETMRVVYGGNYYDITKIQELDREALLLTCNKKV